MPSPSGSEVKFAQNAKPEPVLELDDEELDDETLELLELDEDELDEEVAATELVTTGGVLPPPPPPPQPARKIEDRQNAINSLDSCMTRSHCFYG